MAFFTRVNLNVPILPPMDSPVDSNAPCGFPPAPAAQHRRHSSEPAANPSVSTSTSVATCTSSTSTDEAAATTNGVLKAADKAANGASVHELESDRNGKDEETPDDNNSGEPKRYEYIVDRVLGVEV